MTTTAHTDATHATEGAAGQAAVVNDFFNRIDALSMPTVIDRDLTSAPSLSSPGDDGKRYIVGAAHASWTGTRNGTAATAFVAGDLAVFYGGGFIAWAPEEGWAVHVDDEDCWVFWDGTAWVDGSGRRAVLATITASTTQTQGAAQQLRFGINRVTTCANANDAVKLPAARAGAEVFVFNRGAQTVQIFPASGDKINGGAADASTTLAANAHAYFGAVDGTDWYKITGA